MSYLDRVGRTFGMRLLFMAVIAVILSPLIALDEIQRWRARRAVREQATSACRTRPDEQACQRAIAERHETCWPKAIMGTSAFDGPRTDVETYLSCVSSAKAPAPIETAAATTPPPAPEPAPQPTVVTPLSFSDPAKAKRFEDVGKELASLKGAIEKLASANDLAALEAQKKLVDASCTELASADEFLVGLAHPDATKVRVSGKNACTRDRPLGLLTSAVALIGKKPAQKKPLCALAASALKSLEDAHETNDDAAKDAIASLGKACM